MALRKKYTNMQKNEIIPLFIPLTNINLQWIKDLNGSLKTFKILYI